MYLVSANFRGTSRKPSKDGSCFDDTTSVCWENREKSPLIKNCQFFIASVNKQLLDEVEHDIMNYQYRGLCYLPKPKAEADNTDTRF